jgi:hypothetical protein
MGRWRDNIPPMGKPYGKALADAPDSRFGITDMDALSIISANLKRLKESSQAYRTYAAIEKRTAELGYKVGKSTIQRMVEQPTPLGLQAVDVLARVYGLDAWQLLVPELDPQHPPVLRFISAREEEIYRRAGAALKELQGIVKPV